MYRSLLIVVLSMLLLSACGKIQQLPLPGLDKDSDTSEVSLRGVINADGTIDVNYNDFLVQYGNPASFLQSKGLWSFRARSPYGFQSGYTLLLTCNRVDNIGINRSRIITADASQCGSYYGRTVAVPWIYVRNTASGAEPDPLKLCTRNGYYFTKVGGNACNTEFADASIVATLGYVKMIPANTNPVTTVAPAPGNLLVSGAPQYQFEAVAVGASKSVAIGLTNTGSSAISIDVARIGLAAPFAQTSSGCVYSGGRVVLTVQQSCVINIAFSPKSVGNFANKLNFNYSGAGITGEKLTSITLKGEGIAAAPDIRQVAPDANAYTFPGTTRSVAFAVQNFGGSAASNVTLELNGPYLFSAGFLNFSGTACGNGAAFSVYSFGAGYRYRSIVNIGQLSPGQSCSFTITYKPLTYETYATAELLVSYQAPNMIGATSKKLLDLRANK